MIHDSTLQQIQDKIQALSQSQQLSVKVEALDDLLKVRLNCQTGNKDQEPNYEFLWESVCQVISTFSENLKGVFTQILVIICVNEKQKWSNSLPLNSNGVVANTQTNISAGGIGVIILVAVVLVIGFLSRGTSTAPTTPSVQTKDPNCLYIPESSVPRGMSYEEYKAKVKRETGAKCVFFTGG